MTPKFRNAFLRRKGNSRRRWDESTHCQIRVCWRIQLDEEGVMMIIEDAIAKEMS